MCVGMERAARLGQTRVGQRRGEAARHFPNHQRPSPPPPRLGLPVRTPTSSPVVIHRGHHSFPLSPHIDSPLSLTPPFLLALARSCPIDRPRPVLVATQQIQTSTQHTQHSLSHSTIHPSPFNPVRPTPTSSVRLSSYAPGLCSSSTSSSRRVLSPPSLLPPSPSTFDGVLFPDSLAAAPRHSPPLYPPPPRT